MTIWLESNPDHTVGDGYLPNCVNVSPNTALDMQYGNEEDKINIQFKISGLTGSLL